MVRFELVPLVQAYPQPTAYPNRDSYPDSSPCLCQDSSRSPNPCSYLCRRDSFPYLYRDSSPCPDSSPCLCPCLYLYLCRNSSRNLSP